MCGVHWLGFLQLSFLCWKKLIAQFSRVGKFRGFFCFEVESLIQKASTEEIRTRQLRRSSVENGGTSLETF